MSRGARSCNRLKAVSALSNRSKASSSRWTLASLTLSDPPSPFVVNGLPVGTRSIGLPPPVAALVWSDTP